MSEYSSPKTVSKEEWQAAREELLIEEKRHTQARDELNAKRRRLPMYRIEKEYIFQGPKGPIELIDLFEDQPQLVLYHFMFDPEWEEGCEGCSMVIDNLCHLAHLKARNIAMALVSKAPIEKLQAFKNRMEWKVPWYSSAETSFNADFGVSTKNGEVFGMSVFLRKGNEVFHTYFTDGRGVEYLGSSFSYYDITPYGRQEDWEDSPSGWPKGPRYQWWRHHVRYENDSLKKIGK